MRDLIIMLIGWIILLICLLSSNIVMWIHKKHFSWKNKTIKEECNIKNGDKLKILHLPNFYGEKNAYIGYEGIVQNFDGENFTLFSGTSRLIGLNIYNVKYKKL